MTTWIWERENWTDFEYDARKLMGYDTKFEFNGKNMLSGVVHCNPEDKTDFLNSFEIEITGNEAFFTSEIEGEFHNQSSLKADLSYHFSRLASTKDESEKIGVTRMMVDLFTTFDEPLSHEMLHRWNSYIVKENDSLFEKVSVAGRYREAEEVIVSFDKRGREKVDYEAVPFKDVPKSMDQFIEWFNDTGPKGKNHLPPLIRAGLAHLYFVAIHPYEDGNGRMSRALAEKALSQYWGKPTLISLSHAISNSKKEYYDALEDATKFGNTQAWLEYFCNTAIEAQKITRQKLQQAIIRKDINDKHGPELSESQNKVIGKIIDALSNKEGFVGGIDVKKYRSMAGKNICRNDEQAQKEIADLVARGIFKKSDTPSKQEKWDLDTSNLYDSACRSIRASSKRINAPSPKIAIRSLVA